MLNPTGSETPQAGEEGAARVRARPAQPRPVDIDPSWKAGRKLEEARRQLGLSLEQVSQRIRVRKDFLEALETMNIKMLPGRAYALAYLRSYAQMLGLDPQAMAEQFQHESALSREDALPQIRSPESRPHPERPWLFALALMLVAASFMGWRALQDRLKPDPAAEIAQSAPALTPEIRAGVLRQVEIRAIAESWLEVRGPDGTVFLSRTMQPGEVYRPDPSPGWTIHARDGGAFQVYVDGLPAGPLGAAMKPVLGRQIDEIQALPAAAAPPAPVARSAATRAAAQPVTALVAASAPAPAPAAPVEAPAPTPATPAG